MIVVQMLRTHQILDTSDVKDLLYPSCEKLQEERCLVGEDQEFNIGQ